MPDREALVRRLGRIRKRLEGTCFDFVEEEGFVEATCPWGNRIRCYPPNERFGRITLGIAYVEFDVPMRAATAIGRFYREVMGARAEAGEDNGGGFARVEIGIGQHFMFRETDRAARALRRQSRPDLRRGLLRSVPEIARQGPHHRGERPASVSIQGSLMNLSGVFGTLGFAAGTVVTGRIYDVTGSYSIALWLYVAMSIAWALAVFACQPFERKQELSAPTRAAS